METAYEALRDCEMTAAARKLDEERETPLASLDARKTEERNIVGNWVLVVSTRNSELRLRVIAERFCD